MANPPRYCRICGSYVAAKNWESHARECRKVMADITDRIDLIWNNDYLIGAHPEMVDGCLEGLLERGKSFLMVQHIGEKLFEIAFIPGGGRIAELSANQQGLAVRESGYGPEGMSAGIYCRQWGSAPPETEETQ